MYSQHSILNIHCAEPWFSLIKQGIKLVEGRKNTHRYKKIKTGDLLDFSNGSEVCRVLVKDVRYYSSIEAYLEDVGFEKAVPGISTLEEALQIYYQWSTAEEIQRYGFIAIFIEPLT